MYSLLLFWDILNEIINMLRYLCNVYYLKTLEKLTKKVKIEKNATIVIKNIKSFYIYVANC